MRAHKRAQLGRQPATSSSCAADYDPICMFESSGATTRTSLEPVEAEAAAVAAGQRLLGLPSELQQHGQLSRSWCAGSSHAQWCAPACSQFAERLHQAPLTQQQQQHRPHPAQFGSPATPMRQHETLMRSMPVGVCAAGAPECHAPITSWLHTHASPPLPPPHQSGPAA